MAFYNEDDEDQQDPNQIQGGVQTGPQSSAISGAAGTSSNAAQTPNAPDQGSNFVGIKQYIDANKPQAAKLGDQAAGVIDTSADQARQGVSALQNEAQNKIQSVASLSDDVSNKLSTAEALTGDERNLIKNTASAKYKGPKDETGFGDTYTNAAKATNTAKTNIDNSGTEQGRMNLIGQINAKPRTQGMNVFDNTLLQAGGGREKLAQAAHKNQDVKSALDQTTEGIRNQIGRADDPSTPDIDESSGAIGQTNKAQADAYGKIQTAMDGWKNSFTPKVGQARDNLLAQQNAISDDFGEDMYSLDQGTLDMLGLKDGQNSYNLNFNNYLNQVSSDQINAANVASNEDYARYGALADLAGVSPEEFILKQENIGQAGKMPTFGANKEKLAADLAAAEEASKKQFAIDKTFGDQDALLSSFGFLPYQRANDIAGAQGMVDSISNQADRQWLDLVNSGQYAGTAGTSFRNLKTFLDDLKKNQNAIKKNA